MNLVEEITKVQLMTPAQAITRHILVDGTPVLTVSQLAGWRHLTKALKVQKGPPFRKIGKYVYYEVESFDKFMEGESALG